MSAKYKLCVYVFCVFLSVLAKCLLADHYVAQAGQTPVSPYTNWADAASNIQEAASVAMPGSTVWVGPGNYAAMSGSNTVVRFENKSLTLRGDDANPSNVVVDGGGVNRGVYINLTVPDLSVELDGFLISNCVVAADGGGLLVQHNTIQSGNCMVRNCVIAENNITGAATGGGFFSWGQGVSSFLTRLSNCVIRANTATAGGGGGVQGARAEIVDSRFEFNTTSGNAGAFRVIVSDVVFRNCDFNANTCDGVSAIGGAIEFYLGQAVLDNCRFTDNESMQSHGGAIYTRASIALTNCTFVNNRANAAGGYGGAIYVYSGAPYVSMYNCLVASNLSDNGSAAAIYSMNNTTGTYVIVNSTITANPRGITIYGGTESPNVEIRNSIIYLNDREGTAYNYSLTGSGTRLFYNSVTYPYPASYDGGGNSTNDPLFVAFDDGDYRLKSGSPCINAGTNQPWMAGAVDLDGRTRIDRFSGRVDIGCYEYIVKGTLYHVR